jgi:hypothetical protein
MVMIMPNRAERRKAGKTDKVKTYVLTQDQIDQMKADAMAEGFRMCLSIPLMVLHDKFGFGRIRGTRFMDYAMVWYEAVMSGKTSLTEIMKIAEDLTGVKFIMDTSRTKKKN